MSRENSVESLFKSFKSKSWKSLTFLWVQTHKNAKPKTSGRSCRKALKGKSPLKSFRQVFEALFNDGHQHNFYLITKPMNLLFFLGENKRTRFTFRRLFVLPPGHVFPATSCDFHQRRDRPCSCYTESLERRGGTRRLKKGKTLGRSILPDSAIRSQTPNYSSQSSLP